MALGLATDVRLFVTELSWNPNSVFAPVRKLGSDENLLRLGIAAYVVRIWVSIWPAMMGINLHPFTSLRVSVVDIIPECMF